MGLRSFDHLRERIAKVRQAPAEISRAAAPRILAKFREDATTARGNVPSYGPNGDIPISVEARPEAIVVTGPDWCIEKAKEKNQLEAWTGIIHQEANRILRGGGGR